MCPCFRVPVSATSNFLIHHFYLFMKKLTSLLMLALFLFTGLSMKAQTGWYAPGDRLDVSKITPGTDVFIYSMCYVNGNTGGSDYSRFIVNNGNNATTGVGKPSTLVTNNLAYIWRVRSVETVNRTENDVNYTGVQLTFSRNMGSDDTTLYWGIGGATGNTSAGDPQKFVFTLWKSQNPYVSGTSKSGADVHLEDASGHIIPQSSIGDDDRVYLMCSLSGKAINTSGGNYGGTKFTNGYPVALYSVRAADAPADPLGFHVSAAPTTTDGVTVWNEDTKWYKLKMNSSSWRYVETSGSYTDASGKLILTNGTSSNLFTGAWAVVGDDANGYQFYNMGEGPSKVLGVTGSEENARTSMVDAATPGDGVTTTFKIVKHTDGKWYIKKHGNNNEYLNNRDYYVALWNSGDALGNSGSSFMFEAIEDVTAYATAAQRKLVSRVGMWKKVPAVWAEASTVYNALNGVTLSATVTNAELVTAAAAQKTAGSTFVNAVNNQRVTLSNCSAEPAQRVNSFMYYDTTSNTVKGRNSTTQNTNNTLDEVFTLKPCDDITLKIYNATANKYIGKPTGTTSGSTSVVNEVAEAGATAFDIYTSNDFADNSVVFCMNGIASMHLLGGLNVSNYSDNTDGGSRWLLSTDVSRHELQTAINNATTFKTNLETLVTNLVAAKKISVKPTTLSVTLPTAITKAHNALNNASGTPATRTAAAAALNATLTKAKSAWLGEFGTAQQFRLKSRTITNYYLTANQVVAYNGEGVLRLFTAPEVGADNYETVLANQTFTLVPGTGADAGKYILQSNGKQIKTGNVQNWNASMSDAGSPYTFEFTDLANALVRVKTAEGYVGPNANVTTTNVETVYNNANNANDQKNGHKTNSFVYLNHGSNNGNIVWTLEFVAPIGSVDDAKAALQIEYNRVHAWYTTNWKNLIKTDGPTMKAYSDACTSAEQIIATSSGLTVYDVNTAKVTLTETYKMMLQNLLTEADPRQFFALRNAYEKPVDNGGPGFPLYMEIVSKNTAEGIKLQAKATTAETQKAQSFKFTVNSDGTFVIGTGEGQRIVKTSGSGWDTQTADEGGHGFIIESVESVEGGFRILTNANQGFGPNMQTWQGSTAGCNVVGAPIYYNQAPITNENLVWVLETVVSSELMEDMKSSMDRLSSYNTNTHIGTGLGQYSYTGSYTKDFADAAIASANDIYTSSGAYEETPADNAAILYMLNTLNAAYESLVINQPTPDKLYRFKGKKSKKYMASSSSRDKMVLNEANGIETVFQLVEDNGNYKLLNCGNGYFITNTHDASALKANANTITFNASESSSLGYYTIKTSYSSPYIYDDVNETEVDRHSSYDANYCDWTIEEVTYLPVPINTTVGFGTLYSPVDLKGVCGDYVQDERLEFYYGTRQEVGDGKYKLVLTKLEGDIPAETGFVVKYKGGVDEATGCVFMKIATDTDPALPGSNELTGTLETVAKPANGTVYTLQNLNNTLGLYKYTGANVKGGKAYYHLANGSAAPMGFVFDFEGQTTGVESIEVNADNQVIYDLSGRRVAKAGKGLYIINGKKVLVK